MRVAIALVELLLCDATTLIRHDGTGDASPPRQILPLERPTCARSWKKGIHLFNRVLPDLETSRRWRGHHIWAPFPSARPWSSSILRVGRCLSRAWLGILRFFVSNKIRVFILILVHFLVFVTYIYVNLRSIVFYVRSSKRGLCWDRWRPLNRTNGLCIREIRTDFTNLRGWVR